LGSKVIVGIGIAVIAVLIAYGIIYPTDPIPNVNFFDTSINKNKIQVGGSAIISVNAISHEDEARNLQVVTTAIGPNADIHLTYPKITPLADIESEGGISSPDNKHITIAAIDRSGLVTPFDIKIELQVDGITTDIRTYDLDIIE